MSSDLIGPAPNAHEGTKSGESDAEVNNPERKSLTPGHSFFQSLQNFRQSTKMSGDQG